MLSLNTNLSLETIKKSLKLGDIKCDYRHITKKDGGEYWVSNNYSAYLNDYYELYPAPTIADVIDNAESLFGEEIKKLNCIHKIQRDDCELCIKNQSYEIIKEGWRNQSHEILSMCLNNKPLKEIEDYIIKNIK